MSKEEKRPTDPLTASDAAQIMRMEALNGRIDGIAHEQENIRSNINYFSADFQLSRDSRNKMEFTELQKEREILKQRLAIIDDKLKVKADEKNSDSQKMRAVAVSSWEDKERLEKEQRAVVWRKRWDAVITGIMVTAGVGLSSAVFAFLWWLFQSYVNR